MLLAQASQPPSLCLLIWLRVQAFDELVLLKRGGLLIYNGPTGAHPP